jgi:hypothetical protein
LCYLSSVSRLWIERQCIARQPFTQAGHVGTSGKLKPKEASNTTDVQVLTGLTGLRELDLSSCDALTDMPQAALTHRAYAR